MKNLLIILTLICIGFTVNSAFSSDSSAADQDFGRFCSPPVC